MILGNMTEARKSEVFIEDIDAETLSMMISFIYTGDFEVGDSADVQMVARAGDKYDVKGLMDLFCFKMKTGHIKDEFIADMLIIADRYNSKDLRALAMDKLKANKNILDEKEFREKMATAENKNLVFEIFKDL